MKIVIFVSIMLALFSFGTTVLVYDKEMPNSKVEVAKKLPAQQNMHAPTQEPLVASSTSTQATTTSKKTPTVTSTKPTSQQTPKPTLTKDEAVGTIKKPSVSSVPLKTPTITTSTDKKLTWGVFTGSNPTTIHDFEKRVAENPDYLAYFIHWGNGNGALPAFLSDFAYEKNRTLVLFWEASDYKIGGTDQPAYSYNAMLRGDWDEYFESFARQLKEYKGPVILIPFSELNGNWTPWSGTKNGNTPELAVEAFQYVHGFFADLDNVKIGWAVNSVSVPQTDENAIGNYYPGDEFVDIVGVDGFNMGNPWLSFSEIFGNSLSIITKYNKPVFIFSFGTAEGDKKADWLDDALNTQMPLYPQITSWIYFNQNKERNWLLWSDEDTFSVFTDYVAN